MKGVMKPNFKNLAALALGIALSACAQPPVVPPAQNFTQTITVQLGAADTAASLQQKYGGKIVVFNQNLGVALIGLNSNEANLAKANLMPNATLADNGKMVMPEDEVGQIGTSSFNTGANAWATWAGGWTGWAGGWTGWAGGWTGWANSSSGWTAWSGGTTNTVPAMPNVSRPQSSLMNAPQAQALSTNFGAGITVAVIDSGIDLNHPMFAGRLTDPTTWADFAGANPNDGIVDDYVPQEEGTVADRGYGHGTGVAGVIAQYAPQAKIMPIRVIQKDGSASFADIAAAVNWATSHGANIINMSFGAARDATVSNTELGAVSAFVMAASNKGVFTVASAGNASASNAVYPAMLGNKTAFTNDVVSAFGSLIGNVVVAAAPYDERFILSVGSVSNAGALSTFSNYGAGVEFYAAGENVPSSAPATTTGGAGGAAYFSGTSFAAPEVTGMLALALGDSAAIADKGTIPASLASNTSISNGKLVDALAAMKFSTTKRRTAMLMAGTTTLGTADAAIKTQLENLGYTVTVKSQSAKLADAAAKDLVVISNSVTSTSVGTGWAGATMSVLVLDDGMFSRMNMTSAAGATLASQNSVNVVNNDHPLAAGLNTGTQAVYSSADSANYGVPATSAMTVAWLSNNSASIFGYSKGDQMAGTAVAPARRVGFYMGGNGASKLTAAGKRLFGAAVNWATTGN